MKFDESVLYNIKTDLSGTRYALYDLAVWKNGLAFKKIDFSETGRPVIRIAELNNGISASTSYTQGEYGDEVFIRWDDLLFSWSGNPETSIDVYRYRLQDGWLNQHIFKVTANKEIVTKDYLYYILKYLKPHFTQIATNKQTTGLGHVTIADLKRLSIVVPTNEIQDRIVSILKALDDKIDVNNSINKNLEEQAQAIFNQTIPFSPDDELPTGWTAGTIKDIVEIHDSKRVPLSGAQREKMQKRIYPYYGAASLMDYVDDYLFDGIYLLLGEDGTVVNEQGYPILQYVWGQFWVNNHAHILTGKHGFNVESLYLLFKRTPVKSIVTGAVQPKISQTNLKSVPVVIPPESVISELNANIEPLFSLIRSNHDENQRLAELRDTLLPKLMSGEIDVSTTDI